MTDPDIQKIFAEAKESILSQDAAKAPEIALKGLENGIKPMDMLNCSASEPLTSTSSRSTTPRR